MFLFLFLFGFILIFGSGYVFGSVLIIWIIASLVALLLAKIANFFNLDFSFIKSKKKNSEPPTKRVNLNDPIGALSVVALKYNYVGFLKDLVFLERQLFEKNSFEVIELFRSAETDPRPEVCGACANKILLRLAQVRKEKIENHEWTSTQENIWERGTPTEWRAVLNDLAGVA